MWRHAEWDGRIVRRDVVESMLSQVDRLAGKRLSRTCQIGAYVFRCYRGRYFDASDGDQIKLRGLTITIEHGNRIVGIAKLKEWWLPPFSSALDFWDTADNLSQEHADVAELVGASWAWHEWPPEYGNIVLFSRLVIDTRLDAGREGLRRLGECLNLELGHRASVMLLKAFPLEFENALGDDTDPERTRSFQRRFKAMERVYSSCLGVQALPDQTTFPGWMWKPIRRCPPPSSVADVNWREQY